ncbi:MAG TPA: MOSC and FAD-binding oxidoreductase domain-containing protein [Actinoallomurus sp.]|nr:MOSC and FAD-binding oxidoreductase domain-containing protein [Actinoallomurus sp.]
MASLLSVNVGMPKDVAWQGKTVHTGIWKEPVAGPRMVRRLNIDGDGQGDLNGHGGEQRAVLVYQIQSYEYWQKHFGRDDFTFGQFGENFTVDGLADDEVCIGDRYRIGEAEFEVTQPRVTCYRVGLRLGEPAMPSLLVAHHRPGFYLRVITEGRIQAGDEITRTRTGPGALSVADTDALLYLPDRDLAKLRTALNIPALSPGWQQSFHDIADAADRGDSPDLPSMGVEPGWNGFRRLRVARITPESESVSSIYLEPDDGAPLPRARPGQYLTLRVTGAGRPAPVRGYSLSSAPGADTYRVSVKREPHGVVSAYLHAELRPGAILDVAAPRGDFVLEDDTNPVLLISAGIGVTPVLAMLHELSEQGSRRPVWWIHTVRDRARHALAGEAHDLIAALPDAREYIFYTAPDAGTAHHGRLSGQRLAELGVPADATAYICGPAAFMADMHDALAGIGVAEDRIRTELFGAMPAINPGVTGHARTPPHQPPGAPGTGPAITFARSGLTVPWSERQPSVLDLADACDVPTRWSCRTGVCHTCATTLLSGEVSYSPPPLEPPGPDEALICCAQPATDIVLDL